MSIKHNFSRNEQKSETTSKLMSLIELTEVNKYSPLFPKGASTPNRRFHSKTGLNLLRSLTKDIKGKSKYAMVKGFSTYSGSDMTII